MLAFRQPKLKIDVSTCIGLSANQSLFGILNDGLHYDAALY
jgi:hypothetical protein